ncbi:MAG: hypothetical protein HY698_18385 [Deltaproteobacteria bacterium]|nr:hypothetical protein [Deltaproteobacteria bacterium]
MAKILISVIVTLFGLIVLIVAPLPSHTFREHLLELLGNFNTLRFSVEGNLDRSKFRLLWRGSQDGGISEKVVFDGQGYGQIPLEHGENDFYIECDGRKYRLFRQFKFNRVHHHSYDIRCRPTAGGVECAYNARGIDSVAGTSKRVCDGSAPTQEGLPAPGTEK